MGDFKVAVNAYVHGIDVVRNRYAVFKLRIYTLTSSCRKFLERGIAYACIIFRRWILFRFSVFINVININNFVEFHFRRMNKQFCTFHS